MTTPACEILTAEADRLEVRLAPEAIAAACHDHFPGRPIVPGVVLVDWAMALAAAHLGTPRAATEMQVKFRHLIRPGTPLTLTLRRVATRLEFAYALDGAVAALGWVRL